MLFFFRWIVFLYRTLIGPATDEPMRRAVGHPLFDLNCPVRLEAVLGDERPQDLFPLREKFLDLPVSQAVEDI
jgi:hypothetical protein